MDISLMAEVLVRDTEQTNSIQTDLLFTTIETGLPVSVLSALENPLSIACLRIGKAGLAMIENTRTLTIILRVLRPQLIADVQNISGLADR